MSEQAKKTIDGIEQWSLGDYDNTEKGCEKCGRHRVCICQNGKHRCEKCDWSPEIQGYICRLQDDNKMTIFHQ